MTRLGLFALLVLFCVSASFSVSAATSPQRLRQQKREEIIRRLVEAFADAADNDNDNDQADEDTADAEARDIADADADSDADAADTSAKIRRLIKLGKREPFFNGFLNGLSNGLQTLAQNTAGALGLPRPGQDRGKGNHGNRPGNRPSATPAPPLLPSLAGAAGQGLSSLINGLVNGGAGGGGGGGAAGGGGGAGGGMVFPSQPQPVMPSGVVTIRPPISGSGAGDFNPAPMTNPMIDPISGVNISCPMLHAFRLENCGQSQDSCALDGTRDCKKGSICCPTMNCNLQCVFPEDPFPRRGRCPVKSRPAIEHALFSGVIEPQSCYYDDHCPADFKCCGPLPLGPGGEPRRYYKGVRQVGATGAGGEEMLETKLCFPAENSKKPIG